MTYQLQPHILQYKDDDAFVASGFGMKIAGFGKELSDSIEITHEELKNMNMMSYRFGSIKNPFPRGLPWRGQRQYSKEGVLITKLNLEDYELIKEKNGLAGKLTGVPGDLIHLIHSDKDKELNIFGYVTSLTIPKVRISHKDPKSSDHNAKRLPTWTDYIPFVDAKHGDKTFALREFNAYRIVR